jgi:uncharacterized protein YutD
LGPFNKIFSLFPTEYIPHITIIITIISAISALVKTYYPIRKHYYELRSNFKNDLIEEFTSVYTPLTLLLSNENSFIFVSENENNNMDILNKYSYLVPNSTYKDLITLRSYEKGFFKENTDLSQINSTLSLQEYFNLRAKIQSDIYFFMGNRQSVYNKISNYLEDKFTLSFSDKLTSTFKEIAIYLCNILSLCFLIFILLAFFILSTGKELSNEQFAASAIVFAIMFSGIRLLFRYLNSPIPDMQASKDSIRYVKKSSSYKCNACGSLKFFVAFSKFPTCSNCNEMKWKDNFSIKLKNKFFSFLDVLWKAEIENNIESYEADEEVNH